MLIDQFVVGRIGAGKAEHAPRRHVAIAAVDRIAEESFQSALPKVVKKNIGGHTTEILPSALETSEVGILLF